MGSTTKENECDASFLLHLAFSLPVSLGKAEASPRHQEGRDHSLSERKKRAGGCQRKEGEKTLAIKSERVRVFLLLSFFLRRSPTTSTPLSLSTLSLSLPSAPRSTGRESFLRKKTLLLFITCTQSVLSGRRAEAAAHVFLLLLLLLFSFFSLLFSFFSLLLSLSPISLQSQVPPHRHHPLGPPPRPQAAPRRQGSRSGRRR